MRPAILRFLILSLFASVPATAATVSGFVRGADNGEALAYATVIDCRARTRGAMTNQKGYYVVTGIPAGVVLGHHQLHRLPARRPAR